MKSLFCVLSLLFVTFSSYADYVDTDWKYEGDSRATLDTSSGKEWLKLSATSGMSIAYVQSQLGEGGRFEGWRLPTFAEVNDLILAILPSRDFYFGEVNASYEHVYYDNYDPEMQLFRHSLGESYYQTASNSMWSAGSYLGDDGMVYTAGHFRNDKPSGQDRENITMNVERGESTSFSNIAYGVMLISDGGTTLSSIQDPTINTPDDVPVSSIGIFLIATLPLFTRRKHQQAQ